MDLSIISQYNLQRRFQLEIAILKVTEKTTLMSNIFYVINVQSHFHKIVILKVIEKPTLVRNIFDNQTLELKQVSRTRATKHTCKDNSARNRVYMRSL